MDLTLGHNGRFVKYLFGFFFGRGSGHDQAVSWPATITGGRGGGSSMGGGVGFIDPGATWRAFCR